MDHVDLFYVHRRQPEVPIEEVAGALGRLVAKGKIKAIGFSEIAPSSLRRAHKTYPVARFSRIFIVHARAELGLVRPVLNWAQHWLHSALSAVPARPAAQLCGRTKLDFLKGNPGSAAEL